MAGSYLTDTAPGMDRRDAVKHCGPYRTNGGPTPRRICHQCQHHRFRDDPDGPGAGSGVVLPGGADRAEFMRMVWYNQICGLTVHAVLDPVTGGSEERYSYCREMNPNGQCADWRGQE